MNEIREEKYQVFHDPNQALVTLQGALMLNGAPAYEPILNLLREAAEQAETGNGELTVDIGGLNFLNSSGINMMTRFVMYISDIKDLRLKLTLRAQKQVAWQERLTINLQRLMPELHTELV